MSLNKQYAQKGLSHKQLSSHRVIILGEKKIALTPKGEIDKLLEEEKKYIFRNRDSWS